MLKNKCLSGLSSGLMIFLVGCSDSAPTLIEVNAVLGASQKAIVFVEGGSFLLGDVGNENGVSFHGLAIMTSRRRCCAIDLARTLRSTTRWH